MERLWAPWRMEYVRRNKEEGCFLCRILSGKDDRESLLLRRGRVCAIVMNRYPYSSGHLMVIPHRHVDDVVWLSPEERLETMDLVSEALTALRAAMKPDGFNVGVNLGTVAGAGLTEHLHTHVVPRWNGDANFMTVVGDTRVIPQSLLDLWDALRPLLNP